MNFASALFSLMRGHKIGRKHWTGYWILTKDDNGKDVVEMHCYDGKVINLLDTEDVLYTLSNIASDDWEIKDDYHATKEQK